MPQPARSRWLALAGLLTALTTSPEVPLRAQGTVPPPPARLAGVVHDSVTARDLAGALVWVEGGDTRVFSDSAGRWAIEAVPAGRVVVAFAHPTLDSLGLTELRVPAVLAPGESHTLTLAGPSFPTLATHLCGGRVPADGGVVFGNVADARGTLFDGARIDAEWRRLVDPRDPEFGTPQRRGARSDARGVYALCGVVVDQGLTIGAVTDRGRSGLLDVIVPTSRLLRLDLVVGTRATSGTAVLQGIVQDSAGTPLPNARVSFGGRDAEADSAATARTDASGRFVLGGLPEGTQMIDVTALGYAPERRPVALTAAQPAELQVRLRRSTALAALVIRGEATTRFHSALETRRLRGFGTIVGTEQLNGAANVGAVLRGLPRLSVGFNRGSTSVAFRQATSSCQPDVYIDGSRVEQGSGNGGSIQAMRGDAGGNRGGQPGNLDQMPPPQQLAALEVYTRPSQIPFELHASYTECGAVYAWTKQYVAQQRAR